MNARYFFAGHETVGAYVARCLEPLGWKQVDGAAQAAVAFTYFTSMTELEDAYFDEEGLVKTAGHGCLLVDLSPSTPSFSRELSAVATVNDLRPVEAPIALVDYAKPDAFSASDNVICFAAGEDDDVDEVLDMLETLASSVRKTGPSGTAQLAKSVRTVQEIAQAISAVEADALTRATQGADLALERSDAQVEAISDGAARVLAVVGADCFEGDCTIEMLYGDVAAAMASADDVDLILPQLESAMHLLEVLAVIGGSDKGMASISLMYRDESECAAGGLDWARAESMYADHDHDHDHCDDCEDDDYGYAGGYGGYSAN